MSGSKLDCPSCGLILTTPTPVPAGTLVNCPRCGTCFGVPALEIKTATPAVAAAVAPPVAVAQAVAAPAPPPVAPAAVPAAAPVTPAAPVAARARAAAPRAAAPPAQEDSWFPELDTAASRRVGAAKSVRREKPVRKEAAKPNETEQPTHKAAHKGRKKNENAALIWSLVVAGVVIVIGGAVALVKFSGGTPQRRPPEAQRNTISPENAAVKSPSERKSAVNAPATEKKTKVNAKKDKATGSTTKKKDALDYDDSDTPKDIPGLPPTGDGKK